ncbi:MULTISPECIES: ImmA/IrrE family metallo-endopeptidase [Sporosarcina]|uniref:Phage family element PBSX protein n=1 Tax=Sporosarcina newyorkensis 2681 TaxID=1027292 RepID=F9DX78_9BACL|nr:ImmA/IrrE family metallo-endopeptidase [Sporosarcina newyorkensis]EGQ21126.1 phage family element PBSX protein [Sporosarcina newyorkensis 2681]
MYQNSHLEDYIQQKYEELSINLPSQLNKYVIGSRLNIGVYLTSHESEAFYWDKRYYIFINRRLNSRQRWQEFGHELCHILRHSGHQSRMPSPLRELQEWQADNFMYHFCVPTFMLRRIRLPPNRQAAAYVIAEMFNVELEFAAERLERYVRKQYTGGFQVAEKQDSIY